VVRSLGRIRIRRSVAFAALALLPAVAAPSAAHAAEASTSVVTKPGGKGHGKTKVLHATVRRTKYGVPHIRADNIESLAAGYAYAFAEDDICTIASEYVTVSGQRSRWFGPDKDWYFSGNGSTYPNLTADFYFKWANKQRIARKLMKLPPPLGPKRGVRRGVAGYVAGYNAYLEDVGRKGIPDPRCRGEKWVRKIRKIDVYRRFFQLGILASSGAVIDGIVDAKPVSPAAAASGDAKRDRMLASGKGLERLQPQLGSNAYGLGKEATKNGRGLVLGNPHFPWSGSERLYQTQLQIPGKLNVEGASLYGVPLVLIGWTDGLAWSHTVATAWRFTPFKLTLPPGDPHSYIVDGETKPMEATDVTVQAKTKDGLEKRKKTIYSTEYGPMIDDLVGIPLPWSDGSGFALRDVNATNFRYLNHFYDNNFAQSVQEYDRIERKYQGLPWVNSIAADSKGHAYYSMQGSIPNVPDELAAECNVLSPVYDTLGLPVLDGSRSDCNWENDPKAVAPGTFPPDEVPTLFRDDYVHNGNDSHWLTNPEAPLTGYDRIIGIENAERTYRTRLGLIQIEDRLNGDDGLPGKGFDRSTLERVALGNRQYLGELWRDSLVGLCDAAPGGTLLGSSGPVAVGPACDVLRNWNVRDDLDSAGAILFRRFASNLLGNFTSIPTGLQGSTTPGSETLFTTPYSNSDPVHTPSGLNVGNPLVGRALADAITDLDGAGIPLDAALRGYQYSTRGGKRIPIHGGPGGLGVFNAISAPWDGKGFGDVEHGSSFIMAAQFTGKKCPVDAGTFVTYSQSENQDSKHSGDYTRAFSKKRWEDAPFCAKDVRRETRSKTQLSIRPRPPGSKP
jgi:acyl-homoserine-lactone acylase